MPHPEDSPFHIVVNPGSGKHELADVTAELTRALEAAKRRFVLYEVEDPKQLESLAQRVVAAAKADAGVVVAAGGDGTINALARATLGSGCSFGVVPLGTFNYFSRAHGISSDIAEACELLLTAHPRPVQVGQVNDRVFLVNASIGLYPDLLEEREDAKRKLGRSRLVAFGAALATLLRPHRLLRLQMEGKRGPSKLVTPTLFVGNNRLQLQRVGIAEAEALEHHRLVAVAPRPRSFWGMLGLMLRALFGRLGQAQDLIVLERERLTVRSRFGSGSFKVATDGEINWMTGPLTFQVAPHPLLLLRRREAGADPG